MTRLIFDIETNGLLPELDRLHCLCIKDMDTGEAWSCTDHATASELEAERYHLITWGLAKLAEADLIAGHNVVNFDIPAIQKVYPWWKPTGQVRDTILMARVVWPKDILRDKDFRLQKEGKLPAQMIGRYSLESFGYRLGDYKGDYGKDTHNTKTGDLWATWNREMQDYCEQDVEVTLKLWKRLAAEQWSERCFDLENEVAYILGRQERRGFNFDQVQAAALLAVLTQRKLELETSLKETFKPLTIKTPFTPQANNKKLGYTKGVPTFKTRIKEFEPSSRDHIAERLALMGWTPTEFTDGGKPKVDETVLSGLAHIPEAKLVIEYLTVDKRLGQLANGKEAWLRHLGPDGRIHGRVDTNGAVTGRMTHSKPNVAQVPAGRSPYGHECRALFIPGVGYILVGADADALELRCLAHFMAKYDDGEYVRTVLEGKKEDGTDIHSVNCRALGMDPKARYEIGGKPQPGRDIAKTWFYAFIYGAGDEKLGSVLGKDAAAGKRSKARFLKNLPALGKLVEAVKAVAAGRGYLTGLDGRKLYCRSPHASLNTLLQSAGALVMKQGLVVLDSSLKREGLDPGKDYEFVANVHDEWQIEARPHLAERVGFLAADAIRQAGDDFNFRCPLAGNYEVGNSWAETH